MATLEKPCFFWSLPLELRFEIYSLVYGEGRKITPHYTQISLHLEFKGRKQIVVETPSWSERPRTVSERRMVNKQYLTETLQHLAETNHFIVDLHHNNNTDRFSLPTTFLLHVRHMTLRWNAYIHDPSPDLSKVCPYLKHLILRVDTPLLAWQSGGFERPDWSQVQKLQQDRIVKALESVRGLVTFELVDNVHLMPARTAYIGDGNLKVPTEKERKEWCDGVERVVRKLVMRPKGGLSVA